MALGLVTEPAAVTNGMPASAAASIASSSAVAEPGIEVMIEQPLSMKARIWLICWAGVVVGVRHLEELDVAVGDQAVDEALEFVGDRHAPRIALVGFRVAPLPRLRRRREVVPGRRQRSVCGAPSYCAFSSVRQAVDRAESSCGHSRRAKRCGWRPARSVIQAIMFFLRGSASCPRRLHRKLVAKQAVEVGDHRAAVLVALQACVEPVRRRCWKRHVAVVARADPGALQRRAGVAVEVAGGGVDGLVLPGRARGRAGRRRRHRGRAGRRRWRPSRRSRWPPRWSLAKAETAMPVPPSAEPRGPRRLRPGCRRRRGGAGGSRRSHS